MKVSGRAKFLLALTVVTGTVGLGTTTSAAALTFLGPTPYLSGADSPFDGSSFDFFFLEDFEDHLFNAPGVSASAGGVASVVFGPTNHDSVDADDGVIDGSGLDGDTFFYVVGATGITFSFDAGVLGSLPTHAGIVWTDGLGTTLFEAFGPGGASLGTIGPVGIADGTVVGTTAEDRFFGLIHEGGISGIKISNTIGGIEVDHLQYGFQTADIDSDGDGVLDSVDVCPATVIPESVPRRRLGVNRWALVDDDGNFDTTPPRGGGRGPGLSFTIDDTGGCSCEQIIQALDLGKGHSKFGCSTSAMEAWVALVNP